MMTANVTEDELSDLYWKAAKALVAAAQAEKGGPVTREDLSMAFMVILKTIDRCVEWPIREVGR